MSDSISIPFKFTQQTSCFEPTFFAEAATDSSLNNSIFEISEGQLANIKGYVNQLLKYIKNLEQKLSFKQNQLSYLSSELESKICVIKQLTVSKSEIDESIQKIMGYNKQYLQMMQAKDQEIQLLKGTNSMISSRSTLAGYYQSERSTGSPMSESQRHYCDEYMDGYKGRERGQKKQRLRGEGRLLKKIKEYVTETQSKFKKQPGVKNNVTYSVYS